MRRRIAQLEEAEQAVLLPKTGAEIPDQSLMHEPRKQVLPLVPTGARFFLLTSKYLLESSQLQAEQDDQNS